MIYAVDDQELFLKTLKAKLKDRVKTFLHPNDAFLALVTDRPTLLITDVFMPLSPATEHMLPRGMDGLMLVELVQSSLPDTKIIVISGNTRSEIEQKYPGKLAKVEHFFNKPVKSDFFALIDKLDPVKK